MHQTYTTDTFILAPDWLYIYALPLIIPLDLPPHVYHTYYFLAKKFPISGNVVNRCTLRFFQIVEPNKNAIHNYCMPLHKQMSNNIPNRNSNNFPWQCFQPIQTLIIFGSNLSLLSCQASQHIPAVEGYIYNVGVNEEMAVASYSWYILHVKFNKAIGHERNINLCWNPGQLFKHSGLTFWLYEQQNLVV